MMRMKMKKKPSCSCNSSSILLLIIFTLLHSISTGQSQWVAARPPPLPLPLEPTPLCSSQLALVNHACSLLLYTPSSPPSPKTTSSDSGHDQGGITFPDSSHRQHGDQENMAPVEKDCCRWLKEVDDVCVCDLLVRLPSFLTRPTHTYSIAVDDACSVTFACGSK